MSGVALHRSALFTLWRLANFGPQLISELADGVGVDVSTMSRLLRQLERDGLVERGRHGTDLRCVYITITAAGEQAHARVSEARTAMLTEVLDDWPQRDRDVFVRLLGRFAEDLRGHLEQPQQVASIAR
jgi:DNA-binding MarR family transcriptional regulator